MDSSSVGSVQYERFNKGDLTMGPPQSAAMRLYSTVCLSSTGVPVRAAGAVAALVSIYAIGYLTGYYIHRCS